MRLKPLVASLILAGSSSAVIAATTVAPPVLTTPPVVAPTPTPNVAPAPAPTSSATPAPAPSNAAPNQAAYNDPEALKAKIAQLQAELASVSHPTAATPTSNWYKQIHVGGLVNVNLDHWTEPFFGVGPYQHSQSTYLELAPAVLDVDAQATSWASGHVGVIYMNGSSPSVRNYRPAKNVNRNLNVDEAYVTLGDFSKLPYYLRAGEMFAPFGYFELYPITQSLTQILSQMSEPTGELGFVSTLGFSAAAYAVSGDQKVGEGDSNSINNYGLHLGYQNFQHIVGYDLAIDYLHNMDDVDAIREVVNHNNGYTKVVPAVSLHGDVYFGQFGLGAQYVTATTRFGVNDYEFVNHGRVQGAKPNAAGLYTNYKFMLKGHRSKLDVGYQWSQYAHNNSPSAVPGSATQLPKYQFLAGLGVNVVKNLVGELQFVRARDYTKAYGGTGRFDNTMTLQMSYMF